MSAPVNRDEELSVAAEGDEPVRQPVPATPRIPLSLKVIAVRLQATVDETDA